MRQIFYSLATGFSELHDLPAPAPSSNQLLIRSSCSLLSTGTERMLIDFGKANWIDKTRQQPEKLRQVLEKASTDGLLTTLKAVQSKLNQPLTMGYCHVGTVVGIGEGVYDFKMGDRVISNAPHREMRNVSPSPLAYLECLTEPHRQLFWPESFSYKP